MLRRFVGPLIILAIVVVSAIGWRWYFSGQRTPKKPFVVAIGTWVGFGDAMIAKEAGFYNDKNISISVIDDPNALLGGLSSGQLDVAQNSIDQFALLRSRGVQASILMVTDESSGGDGIIASGSIRRIEDLPNHSIAYTRGPASEYLIATALRRSRIPIDDVRLVGFDDPGATLNAYVSGSTDAIAIWQPFLNQALARKGSAIIATSRDYPNTILGVLLLNGRSPPDEGQLKAFLDGWYRAERLLKADPTRAKALMAKGFGVPVSEVDGWLAGDTLKTRSDNIAYFANGSRSLNELVLSADSYWRQRGLAGPIRLNSPVAAPQALAYYGERK